MKFKKWLIRISKITVWFIFSLILLLILIIVVVRIPAVQRELTLRAVNFLQNKIGTPVALTRISISFPKKVVIEGLYVEDQAKDTLLYATEIAVNTNLWGLLQHRIQLDEIRVQGATSYIYRTERDSAFNYSYILKAFQGVPEKKDTVPSTPWEFSIHEIGCNSLHIVYQDALEGNDVKVNLGELDLDFRKFDPAHSTFKIDDLSLRDTRLTIFQSKIPEDLKDSLDTSLPDIGIKRISLSNINVNYSQEAQRQVAYLKLGKMMIQSDGIDLKNKRINLTKVLLDNTFISYQQMKFEGEPGKENSTIQDSVKLKFPLIPWTISVDEIAFKDNGIRYDDFNKPFLKKGMDVNHVWLSNFTTAIHDIRIDGKEMHAAIHDFSLQERNGLVVRSLKAEIAVADTEINLDNFIFDSGRSAIQLKGKAKFNSLAMLSKNYPQANVEVAIAPSVINIEDLLYFKPDLLDSLPVQVSNLKNIEFHALMNGTIDNLSIHDIAISALTQTSLRASGAIHNLPDVEHATLFVNLDKFYTVRTDVAALIDSSAMNSIVIPEWLNLTGKFQGTIQRPSIQAMLTSNIGSVTLNASMDIDSITNQSRYTGDVLVKEMDIGNLLHQEETIGKITMKASVEGSGLTAKDIDAKLDLDVINFQFHNYDYTHLRLKGELKKYFFSGIASLKDENLDFTIRGALNYTKEVPAYRLTFDLKNADFKALHLSARALRARGTVDVDLATKDFKVLNGTVALHNVAIYNGQALYKVDSLLFASIDQNGQTTVKISSDIVSGNFTGTLNLFSLPEALERYVNNYFALKDKALAAPVKSESFKFDLSLKKTSLLTDIIFPELKSFEPGPIKGEFNNLENKLNIHIAIGKIHYGDYLLDSILLSVNSTRQVITCELLADNFAYDSIQLHTLKLDARIAHDSIRTRFVILDSLNKEKYKMAGVFRSLQKVFQFHFLRDEIILNYAVWKAPDDNYLRFGPGGITTHNMSLSYNNEKILVERASDSTAMLHVGFRTLELATLSGMISGKKAIVEGRLNGDMNFPIMQKKLFHASLKIDDLLILKQAWGNVDFSVRDLSANKMNLTLSVLGDNTDIRAEGVYTATASDITATVSKINLKIIEPLIAKNIRDMSGTITGKMKITGNLKNPAVRGEATFKDAHMVSTYVNTGFRLKNETLTFDENGILFKNFQILDEGNNSATLRGSINTKNYTDFDLNLNLSTKNFQLLNTTAKDNTLYYGKVKINSRATITGNLNQPVVEMNLGFSDDTQLTYVIPQSDKGVLDQKGIVVFVDKDEKHDAFLSSIHLADTVKSVIKGFSLSANIELSNKEIFNIIIDPITGDKLTVQGTSTLTFEMDPSGNTNLSGRYEISKGTYSLSFYKLVKRTFAIDKGSTITWYGDPLNAMLDIKAIYTVETSPLELMAAQIPGTPSDQYKQRIPFYVYLNIKGELMTPTISFLLDMPQDKRNIFSGSVYLKIQDINTRDSDLNKQVFALLVLKRFMADNPFENQASGDLATSARTSVSRILSDQLNRLSQNVKGVQLNFDIKSYEDYTAGQAAGQTQLQLGVSKNLLNDRLVVKLSGNVDVEGENSTQNSLTDYIGDLALEYKITPDGRLRVTGFRNSDYDMIDGELTKTGAGLIYIKDYNAFKELFKANEKQ